MHCSRLLQTRRAQWSVAARAPTASEPAFWIWLIRGGMIRSSPMAPNVNYSCGSGIPRPPKPCRLAEYTSPRVWNYFSDLAHLPLPQVTTNGCLDAPVANGAHPVVLFTSGYTGTFTDLTHSCLKTSLAAATWWLPSIIRTKQQR
jgi:hypothetical protein